MAVEVVWLDQAKDDLREILDLLLKTTLQQQKATWTG
jgi:plasmid stabilization system protein ParE